MVSCHAVAFDPESTRIATACSDFRPDGTFVSIRRLETGEELTRIRIGSSSQLKSLAFSPDGMRVLCTVKPSRSTDANHPAAFIWDAVRGKRLLSLVADKDRVPDVHFSPDGNSIVSVSGDGIRRVWDARTGVCTFPDSDRDGKQDRCVCLAVSPDGKLLVSGHQDGEVVIREARVATRDYASAVSAGDASETHAASSGSSNLLKVPVALPGDTDRDVAASSNESLSARFERWEESKITSRDLSKPITSAEAATVLRVNGEKCPGGESGRSRTRAIRKYLKRVLRFFCQSDAHLDRNEDAIYIV